MRTPLIVDVYLAKEVAGQSGVVSPVDVERG